MSIATGDLDNDLVPEIYLAQVAFGTGEGFTAQTIPNVEVCHDLPDDARRTACKDDVTSVAQMQQIMRREDVLQCADLRRKDTALLRECVLLNIARIARRTKDPALCDKIPAEEKSFAFICRAAIAENFRNDKERMGRAIQQINSRNVLLVSNGAGGFADRAPEAGLGFTGWSWNAKFADVDNDGLKDIYVANGRYKWSRRESNFFFRNEGKLKFSNQTEAYGLTDFRATSAYSYVDFDNDGDLDIISLPVSGQIRVFVNNTTDAKAISISLRDKVGNRFGIGSKVVIRYGIDTSDQQMVELQAGGGFLSFDAPIAHFGVGKLEQIKEIEVQWSTGERSVLPGPFETGAKYIVTRDR